MTGLTCQRPITCQWPFETDRWTWRELSGLRAESGQDRPDAFGHVWATLEPFWTWSDAAFGVSGHPAAYVRSRWECCRDGEQCEYPSVQSLLLCSIRSLLLTPAVARHLIGASGPQKGHVRSPLPSSFLRDRASGLVPIFVLGLCLVSWVFLLCF
jgi:hypothetical protein